MALSLVDIVTLRHTNITTWPLIAFGALCIFGIVACAVDVITAYRDMEELKRENEE